MLNGIARHLEPIIAHRLEQERLHGADWQDKPVRDSTFLSFFTKTYIFLQNDLITWLLDAAKASGEERTPHNMAKRMVVFSFASTYSSAVVRLFILFCDGVILVADTFLGICSGSLRAITTTRVSQTTSRRGSIRHRGGWLD